MRMKLRVPFEKQELSYSCGPRSLRMVLRYHGIRATHAQLLNTTGATEKHGTTRRAMAQTLRQFGFKVTVKQRAHLRDIESALQAKLPVIVNYRDLLYNEGHYGVVAGMDRKSVYLHDPLLPKPHHKILRKEFEAIWYGSRKSRSHRWMLVAQPKKSNTR